MVHLTRTDEITGLWSYLSSIDWSEPWFLGLGVFHMMCSVITYSTRNCFTLQGIFFGIYLVIVASSEYLNEVAANYWRFFAKQQYFDSSGLFISVVLSIPLLINCLVIVIMWLLTSANIMSSIQRKRLHRNAQPSKEINPEGHIRRAVAADPTQPINSKKED